MCCRSWASNYRCTYGTAERVASLKVSWLRIIMLRIHLTAVTITKDIISYIA